MMQSLRRYSRLPGWGRRARSSFFETKKQKLTLLSHFSYLTSRNSFGFNLFAFSGVLAQFSWAGENRRQEFRRKQLFPSGRLRVRPSSDWWTFDKHYTIGSAQPMWSGSIIYSSVPTMNIEYLSPSSINNYHRSAQKATSSIKHKY